MISTIITRGTEDDRKAKALLISKQQQIHPYDLQIFSQPATEEKGSAEEKFGIALIRKIKQHVILKPAYSTMSGVIIFEADMLTVPAQQALLKLLEEPPDHTIIILTADREESLLPTICSRCTIIRIEDNREKTSGNDELALKMLTDENISIGERLQFAETIAKDHPELWIKEFIFSGRARLLEAINSDNPHLPGRLSKTLTLASETERLLTTTNANQRLVLEQFLLKI